MRGYWDEFLARQRGICFVNDGGGGDSGGGGDASQQPQQSKPAWASEFGDTFDPDKAWSLITKLRETERTLTSERSKLDKRVKDYESANQTEAEKTAARLKALEEENGTLKTAARKAAVQAAVSVEAEKQGALVPSDIYRLLDEDAIKVDDEGKITGVSTAIKALKEERPQYFKAIGKVDGANGRNGDAPAGNDMNAVIRGAFGRRTG